MLVLVTGGSASGKSKYAENLLCRLCNGEKLYIAAMQPCGPNDAEFAARVERHRVLRAGKGFKTAERYSSLAGFAPGACSGALLECLSNLCANELFSTGNAGNARWKDGQAALGVEGAVTLESTGNTGNARRKDGQAAPGADGAVTLESTGNARWKDGQAAPGESDGWRRAYGAVLCGVEHLCERVETFVVVTNEVFSDGGGYDDETLAYLRLLGELNTALAARADCVVEVVCGIPLILKNEGGLAL